MDRIQTLTTERLILRPLAESHAEDLFPIYSDPQTMKFWDHPPHVDAGDTRAMIARELAPKGACWWSLWLQTTHRAVGVVGYLGNEGVPGMGYILHPDCWGQGYMNEAVTAALDFGFDSLGLDRVELWIVAENRASRRLADRLGFTYRGRLWQRYAHEENAHEKAVYGLYAHDWRPDTFARPQHQIYAMQPVFPVHDVGQTIAFYSDRLGFTINFLIGDPPTYGSVCSGEWTTERACIQFTQISHDEKVAQNVALYFFVGPAIADLYRSFQDRGVAIANELGKRPWGMHEFAIHDCNGYLLRFGTPG